MMDHKMKNFKDMKWNNDIVIAKYTKSSSSDEDYWKINILMNYFILKLLIYLL